jgi:hypothetical protein
MRYVTLKNDNGNFNYFKKDKDAVYICIYNNRVGVVSYEQEEEFDYLFVRNLDATESCWVYLDENITIVPHGIIDEYEMRTLDNSIIEHRALYWLYLKKDNSPHIQHVVRLIEEGHTMEEANASANLLNIKEDIIEVDPESLALENKAKNLLDELVERKAHAKAKDKRIARIRRGKRQLKSPAHANFSRRTVGRLHLSNREKYALEEYSKYNYKAWQLVLELDDYEEKARTQELIEALRKESYYRRICRQAESLRRRDKMLGTNMEAELWAEYNKPYDKLKAEDDANKNLGKKTPATYMVEGVLYHRTDLEELYLEFRDMLQSLDWAGEKQLRKVPTKNLALWGHAVLTILNNEELLKLYTEDMPETKGGKAVYGVCPDCGELMLLDEGRDNYCPGCDKLVLENQLICKEAPDSYGYTNYKNEWVDLGADTSYENLFRDTYDDEEATYDSADDLLDSLALDENVEL